MRLALLLSLLLPLASAENGCSPGAVLGVDGQKCFKVVPLPAAFKAAEEICAGFGGHLASVHNMYDNGALTVAVKEKPFWLGGHYFNNTWTWMDDTVFDYSNWATEGSSSSNQTEGDEKCLLAGETMQWTAKECDFAANFVCEADARAKAPTTPTTPRTPPQCPRGAHCYGDYGYSFHTYTIGWDSAEAQCRRLHQNGHLATIRNEEVDRFILNFSPDYYWIGGYLKNDAHVYWNDGSTGNYTRWERYQPNLSRLESDSCTCLIAKRTHKPFGEWMNIVCEKPHGFVCQYPLV